MALFENARPVNEIDREGFARDVRNLMDKPSFKAGVIKDQFIHNILEALDEEGISQSELARRWGKSRLRRCAPRGKRKEEREELLSCRVAERGESRKARQEPQRRRGEINHRGPREHRERGAGGAS